MGDNGTTVTLRVHRFTPRAERERERARGGSPFARRAASPFADSGASSRRKPRGKQWIQDYVVAASPEDTVLDCLLTVKRTLDPSLAFRYSCGHGMCGSDAVSINGEPMLLCTATVGQMAKPEASVRSDDEGFRKTSPADASSDDTQSDAPNGADANAVNAIAGVPATDSPKTDAPGTGVDAAHAHPTGSLGVIELAPLPGFPPVRDLVADIDPMLDQIRKLKPYLEADGRLATTSEGKVDVFEYLQHPDELARYEMLSNCIACGVCEGTCPVFSGGDAFIGPAALIWASRFINDSRDQAASERMDAIDTADGVAACQSVRACTRHCPRGIDVGEEMWQIVAKVRER